MEEPEPGGPPLLSVENLRVSLGSPSREVVSGVGFSIPRGSIVGLAGESGSGKSITALALTRLLPPAAGATCSGKVRLEGVGKNLLELPPRELRRIRGNRIAYIFQEPSASFNPVFTIGHQLEEVLRHSGVSSAGRKTRLAAAMEEVGLEPSRENLSSHPASFSGGMLQRLAIACALAAGPDLLIADEPTTALDTSTQKRIMDLLLRLNREHGMAILFISHNLGLLKDAADRLLVMRLGELVEEGPTAGLIGQPRHAYTRSLIEAVPKLAR